MADKTGEIDLSNRDPNGLNSHLGTLLFNDVIGEPDGTHSIDCVFKLSNTCFELWKGLCYKLMTFCCGCCIAMEWGCEFAYIAFFHIWMLTPCIKVVEINCGVCQRIYTMCINCCCTPCYESIGGIFHHFKRT
ncbi:caveolin-1-like [Saccostrea echinata]|uniref:caveolin-1-like n=1 Tax=Saccostrea echinata TaxID=191078 RepID=UPI002A800FE6|nr:caveolin-1-like [Saccostrea echinata]